MTTDALKGAIQIECGVPQVPQEVLTVLLIGPRPQHEQYIHTIHLYIPFEICQHIAQRA